MSLHDMINRKCPPVPWEEGEKIPWDDPGFSRRMLAEHLSQTHDAASRRVEIIDKHVQWIHEVILTGPPTSASRILDLCCGPGLYLQRLAKLGHACTGIDFGPVSIDHAKQEAEREEHLDIKYIHEDIRTADFGDGFDLIMLIWAEFNVFKPADATAIVNKAAKALSNTGQLLLEVHPHEVIHRLGHMPPKWSACQTSGLFTDSPHLTLEEYFWDEAQQAATIRYFIIESDSSSSTCGCNVTVHASSYQAYTGDEFRNLLMVAGFTDVQRHDSLTGSNVADGGEHAKDLIVWQAGK